MNKTELFISKSKAIWKDKYTYELTEFKTTKIKLIVTCKIHGNFEQQPGNHLNGKEGCKQCYSKSNKDRQRMSIEEFIQRVKGIHGDAFNFNNFEYNGTEYRSTFLCNKHNIEFKQLCASTLAGKLGCPLCTTELRKCLLADDKNKFITKAKTVHGDTYTYDTFNYTRSGVPSSITCRIHGDFEQSPNSHLNGRGCPSCANYGFDDSKPAILYYLSINDGEAYKIGITNKTVEERYTLDELAIIKCLFIRHYPIGKDARLKEKQILTKFKSLKSSKSLLKSGNTELFTEDVLKMENQCLNFHGVMNN